MFFGPVMPAVAVSQNALDFAVQRTAIRSSFDSNWEEWGGIGYLRASVLYSRITPAMTEPNYHWNNDQIAFASHDTCLRWRNLQIWSDVCFRRIELALPIQDG